MMAMVSVDAAYSAPMDSNSELVTTVISPCVLWSSWHPADEVCPLGMRRAD